MSDSKDRTQKKYAPALRRLGQPASRRFPFYAQTSQVDCGAACLAMVLAYFGKHLPLTEVSSVLGTHLGVTDAAQLLDTARWYGLLGRGIRIEDEREFSKLPRGTILHWKFNHFVVFDRDAGRQLKIIDPGKGLRSVSKEEFSKSFTGVALVFSPSDSFELSEERSGLKRLSTKIFGHRADLLKIASITVLSQVFVLALPVAIGIIVDRVVPHRDVALLNVLVLGVVMIIAYKLACSIFRQLLLVRLRTTLDAEMTFGFFDHLISLPYHYFVQRSSGDLMLRIQSNSMVREVLTSGAVSVLLDGSLIGIYLLVLALSDLRIAMVTGVLGATRIGIFILVRYRQRALAAETVEARSKSRGYELQMINGIETLKGSGRDENALEAWSNLYVDELNALHREGTLNAWVNSALETLSTASPLVLLAFGAHLVLGNEMSLGKMLALVALGAGFLDPLSSLISTSLSIERLRGVLSRIDDVVDTPREQTRSEKIPVQSLSGQIEIEDVSFRYSPISPMILKHHTLFIKPGQFVAVVGASGCGKSTLVRILFGLYPPTEGIVRYDGVDLSRLDLRRVRSMMGIVTQDSYIFGTTVRQNIALAEPSAPLTKIKAAAIKASIHDEIMALPMGYGTLLADGGASLSGGQRQRLAIARALFGRPKLLLLDEAMSAVDSVTEKRIFDQLHRLDATKVIVTHRMMNVVNSDTILVLDDGQIVERGTHVELMKNPGLYRELFRSWASETVKKPF